MKPERATERSSWDEAALELGLSVESRDAVLDEPRSLHGFIDGCEIRVSAGRRLEPNATVYRVNPGAAFPSARVRPRRLRRRWPRSFRSADSEWDKRFVVRTREPDEMYFFLTAKRRRAFDDLRDHPGIGTWSFHRSGRVSTWTSGRASQDDLVRTVKALVRFAKEISAGRLPAE